MDNVNEIEGVVEHPSQKVIVFQGPEAYKNAVKFIDFVKPKALSLESARTGPNGSIPAVRIIYTEQKA